MALGEDYNILVMSRIREEATQHKSTSEAVKRAIGVTGSTVTSAGLILAGTFAILGFAGGNEQIQQIRLRCRLRYSTRHLLCSYPAGTLNCSAAWSLELVAIQVISQGNQLT